MMYNEFLEISEMTETYISYKEYSTFIEPIYMDAKCDSKFEFIKIFNDTFEKMVYPAVEKAIKKLSTDDKLNFIVCNSDAIRDEIEKVDFKARLLAYEYLKLYTNI